MSGKFIDVTKLKFWCQKVLPLVYDDSLSYYELLNKVVYKLNELIANNEKLPDYISDLIQEYISSGAIDEVVRELLANYILNVKYPPKGITPAVGDGTADDTDAIQGCIDYVRDTGGVVYFPYGKYLTQSLQLATGVSLYGFDRYSTKLVLKGGASDGLITGTVSDVGLYNLTLDGNSGIQVNDVDVVNVNGMRMQFNNLVIEDGYNLVVYNGTGGHLQIENVVFGDAVTKCFEVSGLADVQMSNCIFNSLSLVGGVCVIDIKTSDGSYDFISKPTCAKCMNVSGSGNRINAMIENASVNFTDTGVENNIFVSGKSVQENVSGNYYVKVDGVKQSIVGGIEVDSVNGDWTKNVGGSISVGVTGNCELQVEKNKTVSVTGNEIKTVTGDKTNEVSGVYVEKTGANKTVTVSNDSSETVNGNSVETVGGDKTSSVDGGSTVSVGKNLSNTVTGNKVEEVTGTVTSKVGGKFTETVNGGKEEIVKSGKTVHVDGLYTKAVSGNASESYSDGNYSKLVSGTSTETFQGNRIVSETNVTETASKKVVNATDIVLNPTNPLTYKTPQNISEYFKSVPMKDSTGSQYEVLVAGENIEIIKNNIVNVNSFGANAYEILYYDKVSNQYYADSSYTTKPIDSNTAFDNAIAYAVANKIGTIFIPKGFYYLPSKTLNLSEDTVSLVGETGSVLVSENLVNQSFINFTVTDQLLHYFESPTVMSNLTLMGNYFSNNLASSGVTAISFGEAWVQHRNMVNIGVSNFNVGVLFKASVETGMSHCSIALCDTGIMFNTVTGYNPVPFQFTDGTIELNGRGIYAPNGGFSVIFISNSGISGGRQLYSGKTLLYLNNCRSEIALDCMCLENGAPIPSIDIFGTGTTDADSGLIANNVELITTSSGYYDALKLFINVTEKVRNADLNYIWNCYNPYCTLTALASITNLSYNIGSQPVGNIIKCEGGKLICSGRLNFTGEKCVGFGRKFIDKDNIKQYNSKFITSGELLNAPSNLDFEINLPIDCNAVITHFESASSFTLTHQYLIKGSVVKTYYLAKQGTSFYDYNLATHGYSGADKIKITIPAGDYTNYWVEIL